MIDRQKALEVLLDKLRSADTNNSTDIDLIFTYLEEFLNNPSIAKGGSKKLAEFEIKDDVNSLSKIYQVTWRKFDTERI